MTFSVSPTSISNLMNILRYMPEVYHQTITITLKKTPVVLGTITKTCYQCIRITSLHTLYLSTHLRQEGFLTILRCCSNICRMHSLSRRIIERNRTCHRLSPTIFGHKHASTINTNSNVFDGTRQFRNVIFPLLFFHLNDSSNSVGKVLHVGLSNGAS